MLIHDVTIVADELVPPVGALHDLQRPPLEERVDHLQQEERVARDLGDELAAHRRDALAHAEARLDEAHLLLGGEAAQLDLHERGAAQLREPRREPVALEHGEVPRSRGEPHKNDCPEEPCSWTCES